MSKQDVVLKAKNDYLAAQDQALQAYGEACYDGGLGEAPVGTGGGFTQADIDAAVKAAVDPINQQLSDAIAKDAADVQAGQDALTQLQGKMDELQKSFDALSKKEGDEAVVITGLQGSLDKMQQVVSILQGIMQPAPIPQPVPTPEPAPQPEQPPVEQPPAEEPPAEQPPVDTPPAVPAEEPKA